MPHLTAGLKNFKSNLAMALQDQSIPPTRLTTISKGLPDGLQRAIHTERLSSVITPTRSSNISKGLPDGLKRAIHTERLSSVVRACHCSALADTRCVD